MASVTTVLGLVAGSLAVASLAATNNLNSHSTIARAAYVTSAAKPNVVHVTGEDFKFDAPDVIPAGLTEFRFLNKGPALHHLAIVKLNGGKTIDDLRAALANPGPPPSWVKEYGGANAPGHSVRGKNTFGNAAVGVLTFDGAGGVTASYTAVFNGSAFSTSVPDTGTYTVNSDCTGTFTDTSIEIHFNLAIAGGGAEVFAIQTDAGNTDTFDAKKQ